MNQLPIGTNPRPIGARPTPPPAPPQPGSGALPDNQRERIATAAMQGLLAASPTATQHTTNAEQYASRAVRYADALIEALNRTTEEAIHARRPR